MDYSAGAAGHNETGVGDSVEVETTMQPDAGRDAVSVPLQSVLTPRPQRHRLTVQTRSADALDTASDNDTEPLLVTATPSSHPKLRVMPSRSASMISFDFESDLEADAGATRAGGKRRLEKSCFNDLRMPESQVTRERAELHTVRDMMMHGPPQAVARLLQVAALGMRAHYVTEADAPVGSDAHLAIPTDQVVVDTESAYMEELSSQFLKEWLASKILSTRRTVPFIYCTQHERHNFGHCNPGVGDTSHISKQAAETRSVVDSLTKTNRLLQQLLLCSDESKVHDSVEACEKQSAEARANKARRYFEDFDADEDGYLSKNELLDFVAGTGREFESEKKLTKCFELLDGNGDGHISMKEFTSWWSLKRDDFTTKTCTYFAQRYS